MDELLVNKLFESFDKLDENQLALVLNQVARRMLFLRSTTPDTSFWYSVLMRVNKWLSTEPVVNEVEKRILIDPPFDDGKPISARTRAIRHMRERSGTQLSACMKIVDKWVGENIKFVHAAVRESWLSNTNNRDSVSATSFAGQ